MDGSLTEEEIESLSLAFKMYDLDGSGAIDVFELKAALQSMGQNPTDEEVLELMGAVDEDNSGAIGFLEFLNMVKFQKQREFSVDRYCVLAFSHAFVFFAIFFPR
jgi:calmodulin